MTSLRNTLTTLGGHIGVRCRLARVVRFGKDENGATAVEFSIVALPFFALMFAILETALAFFAAQVMETAVSNASRLIRTGQAQQQGLTAATFKDTICNQIASLFNCQAALLVDVKTYPTFGSIDLSTPVDGSGNLDTTNSTYTPGNGGDIVVVRAFYEWPVFVDKIGNSMSNMPNGSHLLAATAAFRNEPFPW